MPSQKTYLDAKFSDGRKQACWMCATPLTRKTATADHLIPKSLGGSNEFSNLRPCCSPCNNERGNRELTQQEWERAFTWQEGLVEVSKRASLLSAVIRKQRSYESSKIVRGALESAHDFSSFGVADSCVTEHTKEGYMKLSERYESLATMWADAAQGLLKRAIEAENWKTLDERAGWFSLAKSATYRSAFYQRKAAQEQGK